MNCRLKVEVEVEEGGRGVGVESGFGEKTGLTGENGWGIMRS